MYIGCYVSLGNYEKAQELLDEVPTLLEKKKVGGKDLPTEVLIKKKCKFLNMVLFIVLTLSTVAFYKEKQKRRGGSEAEYAKAIKISCAEGNSPLVASFLSISFIFLISRTRNM